MPPLYRLQAAAGAGDRGADGGRFAGCHVDLIAGQRQVVGAAGRDCVAVDVEGQFVGRDAGHVDGDRAAGGPAEHGIVTVDPRRASPVGGGGVPVLRADAPGVGNRLCGPDGDECEDGHSAENEACSRFHLRLL